MQNEIWKDVIDYEGLYQISNYGKVKSMKRCLGRSNGKDLNLSEKLLTCRIDEHGYRKTQLWKNNIPKSIRVHRIVAFAFVKNPNEFNEVNHIDGNKLNNNSTNLEWCNSAHNQSEAIRLGLKKCIAIKRIKNGIVQKRYNSIQEGSNDSKVSKSSIFRCLNGKVKNPKKYFWVYA